jgi:hypothetical protein
MAVLGLKNGKKKRKRAPCDFAHRAIGVLFEGREHELPCFCDFFMTP